MEMRVLSVINLKGGVAKTISSVAIAHLLAGKGFRVLLVDNDKQGDASRGYRRRDEDGEGIDKVMTARRPDMGKLIQHTDFPGLDIITANMKLLKANLEVLLDQTRQQQTRLKKALEQVREQPGQLMTAARKQQPGLQVRAAHTAMHRQKKLPTQGLTVLKRRHLPATSSSRE